ncbi:MAG: molybdopterin cofactor-binding domain-containing protein, partial [Chloroflexota bacterium]
AFCIQLAEVSVDEDTGEVTVHKLAVLQDVGRALNPLTVEGQIMGGAVQGLGWALYEQMVYDESGQLLTGSLMDYTIPRIDHTPEDFEVILVEVPSKTGPMGARGVGEPPITATASAVANAVKDATGVRFADLPLTPQRVFEGLQARQTMN